MKKTALCLLIAVTLLFSQGCFDMLTLEDSSLIFMMGLDMDEKGQLVAYIQSPVYYKDAKEKTENANMKFRTVTEARDQADNILTGLTLGGKIQTLLIGKRLLERDKEWFDILDVWYRDPKQTVMPRVIAVDGPVRDIFQFKPKDKPRLSLHMRKLVDTASQRERTVLTTLQELRREMSERGMTPVVSAIRKDTEQIKVTGSDLLRKDGTYATSLSSKESLLLLIIQGKTSGEFTYTFPMTGIGGAKSHKKGLTLNVSKGIEKQVNVSYANGKFRFDIPLVIEGSLRGLNFSVNAKEQRSQLEKEMEKQLTRDYSNLIRKCQKEKVDPFGLGMYARAYQFSEWVKVEDRWPETFANATIHIVPTVKFSSIGVLIK